MSKVINRLQEVSADEIMREKYNAREKARLDYNSAMKSAEKRGMEKGMEKGIEKGEHRKAREMAKRLLGMGISPEQVADASELSLEEILELKKKVEN